MLIKWDGDQQRSSCTNPVRQRKRSPRQRQPVPAQGQKINVHNPTIEKGHEGKSTENRERAKNVFKGQTCGVSWEKKGMEIGAKGVSRGNEFYSQEVTTRVPGLSLTSIHGGSTNRDPDHLGACGKRGNAEERPGGSLTE